MSRLSNVVVLIFFAYCSSFSQSAAGDSLLIEDGFFGLNYSRGSQELSREAFEQLLRMSPDPGIFELYSSGRSTRTVSDIVGFSGGFCVGFGLASKPTNTGLTIAGAALIVAGIFIEESGNSKMEEAVARYNKGTSPTSERLKHHPHPISTLSFGISIQL